MHAIFVDKAILESDSAFEKSLLNKAINNRFICGT
jgi:hypothetical protein